VVVVATLAAGTQARTIYIAALAGALLGYGLLSRGFSYVGARPVFIGEVLLIVGGVVFLMEMGKARFRFTHVFLGLFIVWGVLRTVPYLSDYGVDALRDGVTWLYAAFAVFVSVLVRREDLVRVVRAYGWYVPLYIAWVPVSAALVYANAVPNVPGTEIPLIGFKTGDMGVQLAGVAAFILAGLFARTPAGQRLPTMLVWLGWFIAAAITAALNRGAMVAMATTALLALVVRPSAQWLKAALLALVLVLAAILINPSVDVGDRRTLSVSQVIENVTSVFSETGNADLDGSREWRLAWWSTIVDYTFDGPYFWTGKGFGINLADEDGFQVGEVGVETSLRAPHNGHLEILARAGVPGLVLWILLQLSWLLMMVSAAFRAWRREADRQLWTGIIGWLIVYWAACLANMTFDVFLQGPHGGIWFWVVFGLGLATASAIDQPDDDEPAAHEVRP
jgi:O-antigen ligase